MEKQQLTVPNSDHSSTTLVSRVQNASVRVHTDLFINNQYVPALQGNKFDVENPATGEVLCQVAEAREDDVNRAVDAAREAFTSWRRTPGKTRGKLLWKLADLLEEEQDRFAKIECLDNGKPFAQAKAIDVSTAIDCLRYYAGFCDKLPNGKVVSSDGEGLFVYTRHEPIGVCGAIVPWNFSLLMMIWKIAPCVAMGNTIVLKSAEQTPLTCLTLGELVKEAGFPPGVINLLSGFGASCGNAIAKHPLIQKIAFTGSTATGRLVMKAAADSNLKKVTLELGGKSPLIICDDADLDTAVELANGGLFFNAGQVCTATSRIFVQKGIYDKFIQRIKQLGEGLVVGDGMQETTFNGPQVSKQQMDTIMRYIEIGKKEGAKLVTGGKAKNVKGFEKGYFVEPTVFEVEDKHIIAQEEIFGPVMAVLKFESIEEVIQRANASPYGLASAVVSKNITNAMKIAHALRAGYCWINTVGAVSPGASFGGYGQSGIGRELGEYGLSNYTEVKTVMVKTEEFEGPVLPQQSKL
mmetsp:Transcript_11036/g.41148  ORF Transcript_11036/g.41148 Transcript_11036/m.41148 type:complete len:523 (-) Transcript_11036:74-1642(-)